VNKNPVNIVVQSKIDDISAPQWDALVSNKYPFLQHAFLSALEKHGCVGNAVGWIPRHLSYFKNDQLIAAMPLYEKHNSWGEFVFDHAWADAYQRVGLEYYPKLVNAIPFTPASGQRILFGNCKQQDAATILVAAANSLVEQGKYSGIHCLFPSITDFDLMNQQNAVSRNDCQFHWHNQDYDSFDGFLAALKSKKRKNIKQERRKVAEAGIEIQRLDGHTASEKNWFDFTRVYQKTYDRKYGMPAFNQQFFMQVAESIPDQIQLVLAFKDQTCLAGALMYSDGSSLYGRHWGCEQYVDSLHFEVCYYQGIEFCIERGLQRFDPGAQGEHKVARGFVPTRTQSLHWLGKSPFNQAIAEFVEREQSGVQHYIDAVSAHSPYN
jgi:predicted N-acyltransferase